MSRLQKTEETNRIEQEIQQDFPNAEAYRYNSASIRVRVIDERFRNKSKADRQQMLEAALAKLPENTQSDITVLLLLSPEETKTSLMNLEFEQPSPSRL